MPEATATTSTSTAGTDAVLITGMSGSGKSVALRALEDSGYYCVDNLPPELLLALIGLEQQHGARQVAIAMDVRSTASLPLIPQQLAALRAQGVPVRTVFLDATTDTLVRRFSETRRRHPLSRGGIDGAADAGNAALTGAIERERELLGELREHAHVIDTSILRAAQLQSYVKALISAPTGQLTLVFESFAFKRGIPVDADYVFDVRMLPNPHYEAPLRPLTGRDAPVMDYLQREPEVQQMQDHITAFLDHWLERLARDHRSYVTVAIGCTGGQHRSVYLADQLAAQYRSQGAYTVLARHRELDARDARSAT